MITDVALKKAKELEDARSEAAQEWEFVRKYQLCPRCGGSKVCTEHTSFALKGDIRRCADCHWRLVKNENLR